MVKLDCSMDRKYQKRQFDLKFIMGSQNSIISTRLLQNFYSRTYKIFFTLPQPW